MPITALRCSCVNLMRLLPSESVDLTITSPPYGEVRDYDGHAVNFDPDATIRGLWRVTASGGVVVWVVNDETRNGSESGESFRQALAFMNRGFRLHDTMIYHRTGIPLSHRRYEQHFEYMFIFSKKAPRVFNGLRDPSKYAGQKYCGTHRIDGSNIEPATGRGRRINPTKLRGNIWKYEVGAGKTTLWREAHEHPAIFPEKLASDHIRTWSNPDDLVFDPFMGSGTVAAMCVRRNRNFIGCDVNPDYVALTKRRIKHELDNG